MPPSSGEWLESMNQMQHQGMLMRMLQGASGGSSAPEQLAGGLMSRGMAMGKPMLSAGMGMLGLDPMSLGLRAGQAAWSSGAGVLGAGMAGMGVAAGAGIVGAGVSYAGGQMMQGAQQQIGLNQGLRNNFNFMNNQGGRGFTSNQGFEIGGQLHSMTGMNGPSGEVQTFGELSKLAQNMGRMGLAQNVQTVKEFKANFKVMVDNLKVMAHDMGTSMEEAQKMMVSLKSSGVFKPGDASRMTGAMRSGALAGGLAMSEMAAGASIGSQVSRSVGGLGRQGAFGGIKTMEQIGVATRVGAISEEDIYNSTGLTGAEGRQALAASQMQQSASFLQGGRGRRFLASIAGKDGKLDEDSAMSYLNGGMGTGDTMRQAGKNLGGVGRANFLRNEGRLRGAALEKFGGLAQSMVYQQWLGQRGFDPNGMDDRSMLAFQRFSGMGRDEADTAIKQLQNMPEIVAEMNFSKQNQTVSDARTRRRNTSGVEGLRRKFDAAKEHVGGKLQAIGSKILQAGEEQLESWFNKTMGIYADVATEGIDRIAHDIGRGRSGGMKGYDRYFGGKGVGTGVGGTAADFSASAMNQKMRFATMGAKDKDALAFGAANQDFVKTSTLGASGMAPELMIREFRQDLQRRAKDDPKAAALMQKFDAAGSIPARAALLQAVQEGGGVDKSGQLISALRSEDLTYKPGGKYHSEADFEKALGDKLFGITDDKSEVIGGKGVEVFRNQEAANKATRAKWKEVEARIAAGEDPTTIGASGLQRTSASRRRSAAKAFREKDVANLVSSAYGNDQKAADAARSSMQDRMQQIRSSNGKKEFGEYSDADKGMMDVLSSSFLASQSGDVLNAYKKGGVSAPGVKEMVEKYKQMTGDHKAGSEEIMEKLGSMKGAGLGALALVNDANYAHDLERVAGEISSGKENAVASGYMKADSHGNLVLEDASKKARELMSPAERAAADTADKITTFDLHGKPDGVAFQNELKAQDKSMQDYESMGEDQQKAFQQKARHREYHELQNSARDKARGLSIAEQRKMARGGGEGGRIAGEEAMAGQAYQSAKKRLGGDMGVAAEALGLTLSKDQQAALRGGTPDQQAAKLLQYAQATDDVGLKAGLKKFTEAHSPAERASELRKMVEGGSDENKKKIAESQDAKKDPSAKALGDIASNTQGLKGAIEQMGDKVAKAVRGGKDPEAAPGGGAPAGSAKSGG